MFRFPFGTTQELNLDWFLEQWEIFKQEAQTAFDGIDHALDAEIQRVEDAMADLYAARDAAIAAKNDALDYAQSANSSAIGASQSAQNSAASAITSANQAASAAQQAQNAAQSATSAQSSATNAGTSAGTALTQAQESEAWATGEIGGVHVPPTAPQNLSNAKQYAMNAGLSANAANTAKNDARVYSQDSKAWATGIRNGQPVTSEDETYQNNAKYYAESIAGDAAAAAQSASNAAASAASVNQSAAQIAQNAADIADVQGDLDDVKEAIGGKNIVITPLETDRKEGYYSRNNNTGKMVYAPSTTYYTVDPVDISNLVVGSTVQMKATVTSAYGIFITDSGLNVLEYVNGHNAEEKGYVSGSTPQLITLTVPQNAKYMTADIRNAYFTDMHDFDITGIEKDNIQILTEEVNTLSVNGNVLTNKKWVACGDSFTAGSFANSLTDDYTFTDGLYAGNYKVYPFWIGRRNPAMSVINEAISGSTMGAGEHGVNPFSGTRYTSIPADTDYITLEFGINDAGNGVPVGTIDDNDNTTFYGAWNVVLDYLTTNFPFAKIGIIVGPGMQTSNGQQYANAEIAVAKKWGVPYLNIQFESGGGKIPLMLRTSNTEVSEAAKSACNQRQFVNPSSETPNYHPNEKAHEFESTFIEAWLRTL